MSIFTTFAPTPTRCVSTPGQIDDSTSPGSRRDVASTEELTTPPPWCRTDTGADCHPTGLNRQAWRAGHQPNTIRPRQTKQPPNGWVVLWKGGLNVSKRIGETEWDDSDRDRRRTRRAGRGRRPEAEGNRQHRPRAGRQRGHQLAQSLRASPPPHGPQPLRPSRAVHPGRDGEVGRPRRSRPLPRGLRRQARAGDPVRHPGHPDRRHRSPPPPTRQRQPLGRADREGRPGSRDGRPRDRLQPDPLPA